MAMPKSAFFNARASLTPSPVIATTSPSACSAAAIWRFCSGLTRPKTLCCFTLCKNLVGSLSGSGKSRASIATALRPTWRATAWTVVGASPEITLISTPCLAKYCKVFCASGRIFSSNTSRASGRVDMVSSSPSGHSSARANANTRYP